LERRTIEQGETDVDVSVDDFPGVCFGDYDAIYCCCCVGHCVFATALFAANVGGEVAWISVRKFQRAVIEAVCIICYPPSPR